MHRVLRPPELELAHEGGLGEGQGEKTSSGSALEILRRDIPRADEQWAPLCARASQDGMLMGSPLYKGIDERSEDDDGGG